MVKPEHIIKRLDQLRKYRSTFEKAWRDCGNYALPYAPPITGRTLTPGQKERENHDNTAELALRDLASIIMTTTTPPDSKWINLENEDMEAIEYDSAAKEYIDKVEDTIVGEINKSNFYIRKHEFDRSRAGYGTAIMFIGEGKGNISLNFRNMHISDCYLAEDQYGVVDTVYRLFQMSIRELVQMFGLENLSDGTQSKYETDPYFMVEVLHAVYPRTDDEREMNDEGDFLSDPTSMPFADIWIEFDAQFLMHEAGYRTFPFIVGRWEKESGTCYGHGPVMDALPEIKILNRAEKSKVELAEKINNPPKVIIGGEKRNIKFTPGAVNHLDEDVQVVDLVTGANYPITAAEVENMQQAVERALYVDKFQAFSRMRDKEMSATEARALEMEVLRTVAPVLGRTQTEILGPLFVRIMDILAADGKLPEPPEGVRLVLKPINQITIAQRQAELDGILRSAQIVAGLAQAYPEILDRTDPDAVYDYITEVNGVPAKISRTNSEVKQIRSNRAQNQAQAQQIQMAALQTELQNTQANTAERAARARKSERESQ